MYVYTNKRECVCTYVYIFIIYTSRCVYIYVHMTSQTYLV